jgi:hypothetical protein
MMMKQKTIVMVLRIKSYLVLQVSYAEYQWRFSSVNFYLVEVRIGTDLPLSITYETVFWSGATEEGCVEECIPPFNN